jgi:ectoine hydroxylase-related dioxygenase (phytanoyl-CoA dioxygenase family)
MEWHADGTHGEATVLLTLDDVARATGPLGVVPQSHRGYSTRKAAAAAAPGEEEADACAGDCKDEEEEEDQAAAIMATCPPPVWYAYRRGAPVMIDARTLHCAADNSSEALRAVAWFIYNQDEAQGSEGEENEAEQEGSEAAAADDDDAAVAARGDADADDASGALAALRVGDGGA